MRQTGRDEVGGWRETGGRRERESRDEQKACDRGSLLHVRIDVNEIKG